MVLWANLHAGALLFALLLVLSAVVEFLEQKVAGRAPRPHDLARGNLRRLALLAGLACGAILITPNHVALLPHVLESQRINSALSREWFPITSLLGTPYGRPHALGAYFALAATTWLIALRALRRRRWAEVAVPLVLVNLPFASARFVGMAFAPLLLVFSELERWAREAGEGGQEGRRGVRSAIVLLGALGMLLLFDPAVLSQRDRERTAAGLERGADFRADLFPIEAMSFLEAVALRGRLFNSSNWGGYIAMRAYEQYPTFIAGDWVPTGDEVLTDSITVTNRLRGAFATLDKWAIDLLLVERGWMTPPLRRSHGWIPLFQNANAEIYLRDHADNAADLRRVADYYAAEGVPFDPERGFEEQAAFEANRDWAKRFRVQRVHSSAFDAQGARRGVWRRSGW